MTETIEFRSTPVVGHIGNFLLTTGLPLWQLSDMSKLREYRERYGLTQEAFAKSVGATKATICRLESGERTPSLGLAGRIFDATNGELTPSDFLKQREHAA